MASIEEHDVGLIPNLLFKMLSSMRRTSKRLREISEKTTSLTCDKRNGDTEILLGNDCINNDDCLFIGMTLKEFQDKCKAKKRGMSPAIYSDKVDSGSNSNFHDISKTNTVLVCPKEEPNFEEPLIVWKRKIKKQRKTEKKLSNELLCPISSGTLVSGDQPDRQLMVLSDIASQDFEEMNNSFVKHGHVCQRKSDSRILQNVKVEIEDSRTYASDCSLMHGSTMDCPTDEISQIPHQNDCHSFQNRSRVACPNTSLCFTNEVSSEYRHPIELHQSSVMDFPTDETSPIPVNVNCKNSPNTSLCFTNEVSSEYPPPIELNKSSVMDFPTHETISPIPVNVDCKTSHNTSLCLTNEVSSEYRPPIELHQSSVMDFPTDEIFPIPGNVLCQNSPSGELEPESPNSLCPANEVSSEYLLPIELGRTSSMNFIEKITSALPCPQSHNGGNHDEIFFQKESLLPDNTDILLTKYPEITSMDCVKLEPVHVETCLLSTEDSVPREIAESQLNLDTSPNNTDLYVSSLDISVTANANAMSKPDQNLSHSPCAIETQVCSTSASSQSYSSCDMCSPPGSIPCLNDSDGFKPMQDNSRGTDLPSSEVNNEQMGYVDDQCSENEIKLGNNIDHTSYEIQNPVRSPHFSNESVENSSSSGILQGQSELVEELIQRTDGICLENFTKGPHDWGFRSLYDDQRTPRKLVSSRKMISPTSQKRLRQAIQASELFLIEESVTKEIKKSKIRCSPPPVKGILKTRNNSNKNTCTECSSYQLHIQNAIMFSQRQMRDIEFLSARLLKEVKDMKDIIQETFSHEKESLSPSNYSIDEIQTTIGNVTKLEGFTKKWMCMMGRDCNRFCKIMRSKSNKTNINNSIIHDKIKKIKFADEVGGELCHVKVFEEAPSTITESLMEKENRIKLEKLSDSSFYTLHPSQLSFLSDNILFEASRKDSFSL